MNEYETNIYPSLPRGSEFRLGKSCEILSKLENEEKHYNSVRKKYSRTQSIIQTICAGSGSLSVILSTAGLGTSLSGFGIVVGIPLGAVGGFCGLVSIISSLASKKLGKKISKHEATTILAKSKINSIKDLISKALKDEKISDAEFSLIIKEMDKFNAMKSEIRKKDLKKTNGQ